MIRLALFIVVTSFSLQVLGHGAASSPAPAQDREIQFPDVAGFKTLSVDLHTHSVFSDGHVWPSIRVSEALRDGLDAIAITEHLEWQPHLADIPHPDRNRAYEDALASAAEEDILVIAGTEITRQEPAGHINAVFVTDANKMLAPDLNATDVREYYAQANQWPAQDAVQAANDQSAFVFWNHPYWTSQNPTGIAEIPKFHRDNARKGLLHGIEIANGDTYSEEAFAIALKHNLTLIGVSDVHNLIDWDYKPHEGGHRPVTLVMAKERTADAIKEALFNRRTVVWFKNELMGREPELSALLAASIEVVSAEWRGDTSVMRVSIRNHSDADFLLQNRGRVTFMETSDLVSLPAHQTTELQIKPGKRVQNLEVKFKVLNALTAPGKPANLTLNFVP